MSTNNTNQRTQMHNNYTNTSNKNASVNEEFFARRRIQDHFTQIPNAIVTCQMSFAAHWLITYLLYHPPFNKDGSKWNPNSEYLIKLFQQRNVGKHTYYKALNELIELGYVLREHIMAGNIRRGVRYEYDFEPVFKKQNNIEKTKANTKSKKMFPTSQFSASRGEGSINNTKVQNNTRKNNTKGFDQGVEQKKEHTPPSSAIIFKDEDREFSIAQAIYDSLLSKLGKLRLEETLESIKKWLMEDKKRKFSKKDIEKKILEWDERFQRTKKDERRRKELTEIEEQKVRKEQVEKVTKENIKFLERISKNPAIKQQIELRKDFVLVLKDKSYYYFCNPGLRESLEKALNVKLE